MAKHNPTLFSLPLFDRMKAEGNSKDEASFVNIEYLTWPIIRYKREVLFGWVDLLVSFGGIAGLFLGFSLLSGVEIIYYFTMRAFCMLYKNKDELFEIEKEKKMRPPVKYDLSLKPKFGLRPLTAGVMKRNTETPTLNIITEHEILNDAEMDRLKRYKQFNAAKFKVLPFICKSKFVSVIFDS
jgi:Amiloride-sensitive sodium channel